MKGFNPYTLNAEKAVLGCLLHDNTTWNEIEDYMQAEDFSSQFHRDVYLIIRDLIISGKQADIICVAQHLKNQKREAGDETFVQICDIAQSCYAPQNIKAYSEIVKQGSLDRKLITAAHEIIVNVNQQKENRLDHAQNRLKEIADQIPTETILAKDILKDVLLSIDERQQKKNDLTGFSTGFSDLDKITHGLHEGDLLVLAGRPGMGKTLLAMNIAEHVAIVENGSAAIFSLEMSKKQLIERSLISVARIDAAQVQSGKLSSNEITKISSVVHSFSNAKLFIDDRASLSIADVRSKCRRIKREHGLSLVVVDYITLMSGEGKNETIRIGSISRGLKLLARDLNVPVIAISQLNRSVEQRNDKRPSMSDLRQSGAIEQDADLIFFIYRDEVYNKRSHYKGIAEVIIAKHRNGSIGTIYLTFNGRHCRFDDCSNDSISHHPPEASRQAHSLDY